MTEKEEEYLDFQNAARIWIGSPDSLFILFFLPGFWLRHVMLEHYKSTSQSFKVEETPQLKKQKLLIGMTFETYPAMNNL